MSVQESVQDPLQPPTTEREYSHRACTVRAPCQVFEQLPQKMVYRERGCRWYLVGSEALPFPLVGSEWLLLFLGGHWMVTGIS